MGAMTLMAGSLTAAERTGTSQPRMLQEAGAFRMAADDGQAAVRKLGMEVRDGVAAVPFPESRAVTGVAVSGKIIRHDPDYIVRILLRDRRGGEHLILESYEEICDGDTVLFSDYCEETALMDGIDADSVKVVARGATVQLDRLRYGRAAVSEAALRKSAARTAAALRNTLRRQQVQRIADRINEYNEKNNRLWRAGVTELALKPYEVKKRILNLDDESISEGFEYYMGGILEMGARNNTQNTKLASSTPSQYIDHFDWRNRHGKNWMTPVKDQQTTNFCHFFTCIGCLEALTNLYFNNDAIDLDLSEQYLVDRYVSSGFIITDDSSDSIQINGVEEENKYIALEYMKRTYRPLVMAYYGGVCDEVSYPFRGYATYYNEDDPVDMMEEVGITNYSTVTATYPYYNIPHYDSINQITIKEDTIKRALIEKGPLVSAVIWKNTNNRSANHAMALVGYGTIHAGDTIRQTDAFDNIQVIYLMIRELDKHIGYSKIAMVRTILINRATTTFYFTCSITTTCFLHMHWKPQ